MIHDMQPLLQVSIIANSQTHGIGGYHGRHLVSLLNFDFVSEINPKMKSLLFRGAVDLLPLGCLSTEPLNDNIFRSERKENVYHVKRTRRNTISGTRYERRALGKGKLAILGREESYFCVLLSLFCYDLANNQAVRPTLKSKKRLFERSLQTCYFTQRRAIKVEWGQLRGRYA